MECLDPEVCGGSQHAHGAVSPPLVPTGHARAPAPPPSRVRDGQQIDSHPTDSNLVVDVRPRRHTSSGTDAPAPPDDSATSDDRTDLDAIRHGVEVRVERGHGGTCVADLDGEAVA